MELEKTVEFLHRVPLFHGLPHEHLSLLAFSSERLLFHKGERLVRIGGSSTSALLVLKGSADVMDSVIPTKKQLTLAAGSLIGELAMLIDYNFSHTIIANEEVEVLELSRDTVQKLMVQFPLIAEHFSDRIHQRLTQMSGNLNRAG